MAANPQRVELKYGIPTSGIQCVMIPGMIWMQLWYAGNLDTMEQPMPIRELILVEDQEVSFWIIWTAMEMKHLSSSVHTMDYMTTIADIVKMLVLHVSDM